MMEFLHRFAHKRSIRRRLILNILVITILMGVASIYTYYNSRIFLLKVNAMFMDSIDLNNLSKDVNELQIHLENYLSTKESESFNQFVRMSEELKIKAEKMKKKPILNQQDFVFVDIGNMLDTYIYEANAAVNYKRARDIDEYVAHYLEATKVAGYVNLYINKLNNKQFQQNTERYILLLKRIDFVQLLNIIVFIDVFILITVYIMWFTKKITHPIISLSHAANELSKGNFNVDEIAAATEDEISILSTAFNRMKQNIKEYIDRLKEQMALESRLKEQEMQNLIMKNTLKDTELKMLQSQINPHFLFNTLNAGVQLAIMENADRTSDFMEKLAELIRYNMKRIDQPVTLKDEVDNIHTYVYIFKTRFGDKIDFSCDVDEKMNEFSMPCMVLQPLIENAFKHGIDEMESGGKIHLSVKNLSDYIEIMIEDNGKGMEREKRNRILDSVLDPDIESSYTASSMGIGMKNVMHRLNLFFDKDVIFDIDSKVGIGTKFFIRIPV